MDETIITEDQKIIEEQKKAEKFRKKYQYSNFNRVYDWISSIIVTIFVVLLVFTFVLRLVSVKGTSMIQTLQNGDKLFISNLFYTPQQGDIVIVSRDYIKSDGKVEEPLVKRVIATEGQVVDIREDQKGVCHVFVDNEELVEDYTNGPMYPYGEAGLTYPYTVPKGHTFIMGDNRNNSRDSRYKKLAAIDNHYVLGKVLFRIAPNFGAVK